MYTNNLGPSPHGFIISNPKYKAKYDINWSMNSAITIYSGGFALLLCLFTLVHLLG